MSVACRPLGYLSWLLLSSALGCAGHAGEPAAAPTSAPGAEPATTAPAAPQAATPTAPAPQDPATGATMLQVRMIGYQDGKQVDLAPGGTLRSGDRFALQLRVDRTAFIYVVQFFADGTSAVLFPDESRPFFLAKQGSMLRIPTLGNLFALDDAVGEENLYSIASERLLEEADASIAQRVSEVRRSAASPAGAAPSESGSAASAPPPAPAPSNKPASPPSSSQPAPKPASTGGSKPATVGTGGSRIDQARLEATRLAGPAQHGHPRHHHREGG